MSIDRKQFAALAEEEAPLFCAYDWDNSGYHLSLHDKVSKILVCLDPTIDAVRYAVQLKCDTILSHHPLLFKPIKALQADCYPGNVLLELATNGLNLYCAHTSYDCAPHGMNWRLAAKLGLQERESLCSERVEERYKIVVYIPKGEEEQVLSAMYRAGAGEIGAYSNCSFQTEGVGTFLPGIGTHPYIGKPGSTEEVKEVRTECIVPKQQMEDVVAAVKAAHSYEEPVIDVYPLAYPALSIGIGVIGNLSCALSAHEFAQSVKRSLGAKCVKTNGYRGKITRVACIGGAGGDFFEAAARAGAQALVTGEVKYNHFAEALSREILLIEAGHYDTEQIFVSEMTEGLQKRSNELQYNISFCAYEAERCPYQTV